MTFSRSTRPHSHALLCLLLAIGCCTTAMLAQSESDILTLEKARSLYLTGPVPGSIDCDVVLDWDAFAKSLKADPTDEVKARIEKLKAIKIHVDSLDAQHTDIKLDAPEPPSTQMSDGLREQLQGFFQIYWSLAYARDLPKAKDAFQLSTRPQGYSLKAVEGGADTTIEMDRSYLITHLSVEAPQFNAVMTPGYKPGDDGLLRLTSLDETINLGSTHLVLNVVLDYQKVGLYDIPQHLSLTLPGSFGFQYTLTGCKVAQQDVPSPTTKP